MWRHEIKLLLFCVWMGSMSIARIKFMNLNVCLEISYFLLPVFYHRQLSCSETSVGTP